MRVFKKILYILFVLMFVLSLCCCIVLSISSSTILTFTNNETSRRRFFYTSYNNISNSNALTIISKSPYVLGEKGQFSEDTISCEVKVEKGNNEYTCSMISKLYDADSSLIRTSYFPGDGYKYTITKGNDTQTKDVYSNTNLVKYFSSLVGGVVKYLSYLTLDNKTIKDNSVVYDTSTTFNISTFSLSKNIDVKYLDNSKDKIINLGFDKNDYVTKVKDVNNEATISLNYKKTNFNFALLKEYKGN